MTVGLSLKELQDTYVQFRHLYQEQNTGDVQGAIHGENPRLHQFFTDSMASTSPAIAALAYYMNFQFLALLDTIDANNKAIAKAISSKA